MPQRVKSVHPAQHNRSVVLAAHISTRLQRDAMFLEEKILALCLDPSMGKIGRIEEASGETWTGLANIGSWSEGSSVVDIQEVLWSVGSFPTILRAV
jgi:hypothetical protein